MGRHMGKRKGNPNQRKKRASVDDFGVAEKNRRERTIL